MCYKMGLYTWLTGYISCNIIYQPINEGEIAYTKYKGCASLMWNDTCDIVYLFLDTYAITKKGFRFWAQHKKIFFFFFFV